MTSAIPHPGLTRHGEQRMTERGIGWEHISEALRRGRKYDSGSALLHYLPRAFGRTQGVTVVTDYRSSVVITAYRAWNAPDCRRA